MSRNLKYAYLQYFQALILLVPTDRYKEKEQIVIEFKLVEATVQELERLVDVEGEENLKSKTMSLLQHFTINFSSSEHELFKKVDEAKGILLNVKGFILKSAVEVFKRCNGFSLLEALPLKTDILIQEKFKFLDLFGHTQEV